MKSLSVARRITEAEGKFVSGVPLKHEQTVRRHSNQIRLSVNSKDVWSSHGNWTDIRGFEEVNRGKSGQMFKDSVIGRLSDRGWLIHVISHKQRAVEMWLSATWLFMWMHTEIACVYTNHIINSYNKFVSASVLQHPQHWLTVANAITLKSYRIQVPSKIRATTEPELSLFT